MSEQLDQILFGGGQTQGQPQQPTQAPQSDSLDQILFGDQQQPQAQTPGITQETIRGAQESPLTFLDRVALSGADERGREAVLRSKFNIVERLPGGKFAVGDTPSSILPIDPERFELAGDFADVAAEIPVIAGQVLGTVAGGLAEPFTGPIPTTIAGSAAGAGLGAGVKNLIFKNIKLNGVPVNQREAEEVAVDIAVESLFGAAGEALAQGTRIAGKGLKRVIAPKLAKLFDKGMKSASDPTAFARKVGKIISFTSSVPQSSSETALRLGIKETLSPENLNPKKILSLVGKVSDSVTKTNKFLGAEVGRGKKELIRRAARVAKTGKDTSIPVDDLLQVLKVRGQDLGVIDINGRLATSAPNPNDKLLIKRLFEQLGGSIDSKTKMLSISKGQTITPKQALIVTQQFGQKFEKASPQVQSIFTDALSGSDKFETVGLRGKISQLAKDLRLDGFAAANENFSKFARLKGQLKQLDASKPARIESFINRLENIGSWNMQTLSELDDLTKKHVGKTFIDDISKWNAAQDFANAKPSPLRMAFLFGLLGGVTGFDSTGDKFLTTAGTLALGSPTGAKYLLRGAEKLGAGRQIAKTAIKSTVKKGTKLPIQQAGKAAISRILRERSNK